MVGYNIRYLRKLQGLSQAQLADKLQIKQASVSNWESGKTVPEIKYLLQLSRIFQVPMDSLFQDFKLPDLDAVNINRAAVPILGNIACGERITPDNNPDGYADLPDGIRADFALRCKGDSMAPTILDGDLVLIRQQPEVEPGQIAAVNIGGETTLKRVHQREDGLYLTADNPLFPPVFVPADSDREIIIHGLAMGYTRIF